MLEFCHTPLCLLWSVPNSSFDALFSRECELLRFLYSYAVELLAIYRSAWTKLIVWGPMSSIASQWTEQTHSVLCHLHAPYSFYEGCTFCWHRLRIWKKTDLKNVCSKILTELRITYKMSLLFHALYFHLIINYNLHHLVVNESAYNYCHHFFLRACMCVRMFADLPKCC